jgi:hypothetical protein
MTETIQILANGLLYALAGVVVAVCVGAGISIVALCIKQGNHRR